MEVLDTVKGDVDLFTVVLDDVYHVQKIVDKLAEVGAAPVHTHLLDLDLEEGV